MIAEVGIKGLWVVARYLPAFLLRRRFTHDRLSGLVYVDVVPRHEAVALNLAAPASAIAYLQVINLTPVAIQMEQAEFRISCSGVTIGFTVVRKQRFEVGEIGQIRIEQTMQDSQARLIAQNLKGMRVALDGHIEFTSSIRPFAREVRYLEGIRAHIFNENFWA